MTYDGSMMMQNGLYLVQFAVPATSGQGLDSGHGVAYIRDGKMFGGDSAYWWQGVILIDNNNSFSADFTVKTHTSSSQSIFGFFNEFSLTVSGKKNGEAWQAKGETNVAPGREMQLNLRLLQGE